MCIFPALTTYPLIKKKKGKNEQTRHKNNCICCKFLFSILCLTEAKKSMYVKVNQSLVFYQNKLWWLYYDHGHLRNLALS